MSFQSIFNRIRQHFLKILRWMNYFYLVQTTRNLLHSVNTILAIPSVAVPGNFSEVMTQLNLTENDLKQREEYFKRLVWFWLLIFALVCVYGLYFIIQGVWFGFISTAMLSIMVLCQAFRYHFWLFQLKQRKLGCSLQEWFQLLLNQGKD